MSTDFEVSFTVESANELARMSRRWYFWPLYVLRNLYGFALVALLFFGGIYMAVKGLLSPSPDVSRAATGVAMAAGIGLFYWWLYRRNSRKASEALASLNPLKLSLTADGLQTTEKAGATNFAPWSNFSGYREGKTLFLLKEGSPPRYRAIPIEGLTSDRVDQIRAAIRSHLVELS